MSRVGRRPINIPDKVTVDISDKLVSIKGQGGKLEYTIPTGFHAKKDQNKLIITRPSDSRVDVAKHGLIRSLLQNMVIGVSKGFEKSLDIIGVGFKAQVQGKKLNLQLGFSHPIIYDIPDDINIETPQQTKIIIKGIDKKKVGQIAAELRSFYLPEPYKGKGVRYTGEYVRKKAGKAVA